MKNIAAKIDAAFVRKVLLAAIPLLMFFWLGNKVSFLYRTAAGANLSAKLSPMMSNAAAVFSDVMPSRNLTDLLVGGVTAVAGWFFVDYRKKHAKKFRQDEEYGSAKWGTQKDIEPYIDKKDFSNNVILTQTERLTMGKPSSPKYARNKNVLIIGGSGSGKTRFFVKPNIMQMHSSYVVTDPKGTLILECGKMLQKGKPVYDNSGKCVGHIPYKIRAFNTIDFDKSMHYNPLAYIRPESREQDILKTVEVLIANTTGEQKGGDEFWTKAEKLLYTSYIALIITNYPEEKWNFKTLVELINASECREDDESFKNAVDIQFEYMEKWIEDTWSREERATWQSAAARVKAEKKARAAGQSDDSDSEDENDTESTASPWNKVNENYAMWCDPECKPDDWKVSLGRFAIRQYKSYKLAAGKTAKSILISCSTRLAPFTIDKVLEITSYDEMHLDTIGDELTALFIIISDTDGTFNFLVAMMYSQLFNLLCTKADTNPDGSGRLKNHVQCLIDEFANIKQIPNFEKLIATIRSREISACIILQAKSQLKANYKDNADTIEGNCDTTVFLGGKEKTTLKEISESLGKETIYMYNTGESRGQSQSYNLNYQKVGKELKSADELAVMDNSQCVCQIRGLRPFLSKKYDITRHPMYKALLDYSKKNLFDTDAYISRVKKCHIDSKAEKEKHTEYTIVVTDNSPYTQEDIDNMIMTNDDSEDEFE